MKSLLAILLAFVATVCLAEPPNKAAEELDIREATYRHQFRHSVSSRPQTIKNYYLAITVDGKRSDPDDAFIARFAENKLPVTKHSECDTAAGKGVVGGIIFDTRNIKWVSDTEVKLEGRCYGGAVSAAFNIFTLRKVDGKWMVQGIENVPEAVS